MKIRIDQLFQVIANVGVVAGIIFLAVEIKQNTQSLNIGAYQQLITQIDSMARLRVQDPRLGSELNSAIRTYPDGVTDEEIFRINSLFFILTRHADLAYYQFEQNTLSESRLDSSVAPLRTFICTAAYKDFWKRADEFLVLEFRQYIDSQIGRC